MFIDYAWEVITDFARELLDTLEDEKEQVMIMYKDNQIMRWRSWSN